MERILRPRSCRSSIFHICYLRVDLRARVSLSPDAICMRGNESSFSLRQFISGHSSAITCLPFFSRISRQFDFHDSRVSS